MTPDALWQRAMIAELGLDSIFSSAQLGFTGTRVSAVIKPNKDDIDRAFASIRAWRDYLPPACVSAMIKDGWHWST